MITQPGIYFDIDPAAYLLDPCPEPSVSQSLIKLLLDQSPAHARQAHPRRAPQPTADEYRKDRAIGNAIHLLLLERGKKLAVGDYPDWRTKEAKAFRADAEQRGRTPILFEHFDTAQQIVRAAEQQLIDRSLFDALKGDGGNSEVVLAWQESDCWMRAMIDRLRSDRRHVIDLKTTGQSAAPHAVGGMVGDWAIQAATHERGLDALDPDNAGRRRHTFVVIEQYEPYALAVYDLPESVMRFGRTRLGRGLSIWADCMRTNRWPAYPLDVQYPTLPPWTEQRWVADEIDSADQQPAERPNLIMAG